jgi:hypothetical protein
MQRLLARVRYPGTLTRRDKSPFYTTRKRPLVSPSHTLQIRHAMSPSLETRPTASRSMGLGDFGLDTFGNFDLVKRLKLDFVNVVVSKWRSRVTGLDVVHLDYNGK